MLNYNHLTKMKHFFFTLSLSIFFIISVVSCSGELHRSGKMSENYIVSRDDLFLTYENDEKRYVFAVKLDPLSVNWEKEIANLSSDAVFKLHKDHIICNCEKGYICFLSAENGDNVFSFPSSLIMEAGFRGLAVSDSQVFSICEEKSICSYDIKTGEMLWNSEIKKGMEVVLDFSVKDKTLVYGSEKNIIALSTETGELIWKSEDLEELEKYDLLGETILVTYTEIDGLDISDGKSKWLSPYRGNSVRCTMDGVLIAASETHFTTLFIENGSEIMHYPREGTTLLKCHEEASLAAYTVKKNPLAEDKLADYYDKIYIFDAGTGKRIFDYRSDEDRTVLNIAEMLNENFYIVHADKKTEKNAIIDSFSYFNWEKEVSYTIPDPESGKNLHITLSHIDDEYTIFTATVKLPDSYPATNYLFKTESGNLVGEMTKRPDIITSRFAYDIIIYDAYFNIIQRKMTDFLK